MTDLVTPLQRQRCPGLCPIRLLVWPSTVLGPQLTYRLGGLEYSLLLRMFLDIFFYVTLMTTINFVTSFYDLPAPDQCYSCSSLGKNTNNDIVFMFGLLVNCIEDLRRFSAISAMPAVHNFKRHKTPNSNNDSLKEKREDIWRSCMTTP